MSIYANLEKAERLISVKDGGYDNINKAKKQLIDTCVRYGKMVGELEKFTDFLEIDGATKYKPLEEFSKVNNKSLRDIREALTKLSKSLEMYS